MPRLHFSRSEFDRRLAAAGASLDREALDGLVLFRQDSMYYLTGYDTSGYTMFQGMYLGADGSLALLTRTADRLQSRETSIVEDIRIWHDREDASPGDDLRAMLEDYGCRGKRLGVEYHAYGLTGQRAKMVDAALDGFCELVDASDLIRLLRLVKSAEELAYVRKAGELCDRILRARRRVPALPRGDDVQHPHRHPGPRQVAMNRACADAIDACQAVLRPGKTVGDVFDVHAQALAGAGFGHASLAACGYTMGRCTPRPGWTGRWCGPATPRCSSPGWCSSSTWSCSTTPPD